MAIKDAKAADTVIVCSLTSQKINLIQHQNHINIRHLNGNETRCFVGISMEILGVFGALSSCDDNHFKFGFASIKISPAPVLNIAFWHLVLNRQETSRHS